MNMDWINTADQLPDDPGLYFVYCEAGQWDSWWPAVAQFDGEKFHPVNNDSLTRHVNVRAWVKPIKPDWVPLYKSTNTPN